MSDDLNNYSDKEIVIITGCNSGIGFAIAEALNEEYHVINISNKPSKFDDLICDISDACALSFTIDELFAALGDQMIFYLINNAGIMPLEKDSVEHYDKVMNTNLRSAYQLSTRLSDWIYGGIINISSVSALTPVANDSIAYGLSKAGLITLTTYLQKKYPKKSINCISPGFTEATNLVSGETPQELIDSVPAKRECTPNEIAILVKYLLYEGNYIRGQNLIMDGGLTL